MLKRAAAEINQPFIFYLHPWEVDPDQPRIPVASALSRFRHYTNLKRCMPRLSQLLDDFDFTTVQNVIDTRRAQSTFTTFDNTTLEPKP